VLVLIKYEPFHAMVCMAMAISAGFLLLLSLFHDFKPGLPSLLTNISSGSLQWLQHRFTMVNLQTFTSLTYLSRIPFLGGNAQANRSQLMGIVPKREVLYVGGQYTSITASLDSHRLDAYLTRKTGHCNQFYVNGYDRPNLRRKAFS
jgi:hypothetical protein